MKGNIEARWWKYGDNENNESEDTELTRQITWTELCFSTLEHNLIILMK